MQNDARNTVNANVCTKPCITRGKVPVRVHTFAQKVGEDYSLHREKPAQRPPPFPHKIGEELHKSKRQYRRKNIEEVHRENSSHLSLKSALNYRCACVVVAVAGVLLSLSTRSFAPEVQPCARGQRRARGQTSPSSLSFAAVLEVSVPEVRLCQRSGCQR